MSIMQMSLIASVFIVFVTIIRMLVLNSLAKRTFVYLWTIAIVQLLVPIRIPSRYNIYTLFNNYMQRNEGYTYKIMKNTITGINNLIQDNLIYVPQQEMKTIHPMTICWLIVMILFILYFLINFIKSYQKIRVAVPIQTNDFITRWIEQQKLYRKLQIMTSDIISTPIAYGFIHPKIILPKGIDYTDIRQLEYILSHELIHIKRFDALWKIGAVIALCIHWFNPMVWLLYILLNRDIEMSCDEKVISIYGEDVKSDYALSILNLAEQKLSFFSMHAYDNAFCKNAIKERIVCIMKLKKTSKIGQVLGLAFVFGSLSLVAFAKDKDIGLNRVVKSVIITDSSGIESRFSKEIDSIYRSVYTAEEYEERIKKMKEISPSTMKNLGWTQQELDETIRRMEKLLEEIKSGKVIVYKLDTIEDNMHEKGEYVKGVASYTTGESQIVICTDKQQK
ncbi:M56 family metallopeptidase [Clostridiaceae bacterium M8S5]|nr:M56 family metallopeptidase [Clostridiaceae bacterium M8S5]